MYSDSVPAIMPKKLHAHTAYSKVGVRGYPYLDAAQALLLQTARDLSDDLGNIILDLTAMGGASAAVLQDKNITLVEKSRASLNVLQQHYPQHTVVCGLQPLHTVYESILITLPADKGNEAIKEYLHHAYLHCQAGGMCLLAGDKNQGFERYFKWFKAAFGEGEILERSGGLRVAGVMQHHAQAPETSQNQHYSYKNIHIETLPGVFSSHNIDVASALLLEHLPEVAHLKVLDIGAGAGILGLYAASLGAEVTLLEDDISAVNSIERNMQHNNFQARVLHSDVGSALSDEQFDLVLINPPFHVGSTVILDVAAECIACAGKHLKPGGKLLLVANAFLPYEKLIQHWGEVSELRRNKSFKVLQGIKKP